ncbi:uncharacterized protein LOC126065188 [Elephas maximus indicus]|uniref:uncharacterized protein LOC126065188 n=1 Tax=Elephas maximus indicus TaxID=99487 RepID=UPI002115E92C|nr:uncharacterized protein LOC126065188 [Elephas maximus indicus]
MAIARATHCFLTEALTAGYGNSPSHTHCFLTEALTAGYGNSQSHTASSWRPLLLGMARARATLLPHGGPYCWVWQWPEPHCFLTEALTAGYGNGQSHTASSRRPLLLGMAMARATLLPHGGPYCWVWQWPEPHCFLTEALTAGYGKGQSHTASSRRPLLLGMARARATLLPHGGPYCWVWQEPEPHCFLTEALTAGYGKSQSHTASSRRPLLLGMARARATLLPHGGPYCWVWQEPEPHCFLTEALTARYGSSPSHTHCFLTEALTAGYGKGQSHTASSWRPLLLGMAIARATLLPHGGPYCWVWQ